MQETWFNSWVGKIHWRREKATHSSTLAWRTSPWDHKKSDGTERISLSFDSIKIISQTVKASACNVGDPGLIPGSGRSPGEGNGNPFQSIYSTSVIYIYIYIYTHTLIGEGNGNPLQYSCLGNPTHRRAWQAAVHRVAKESDMTCS